MWWMSIAFVAQPAHASDKEDQVRRMESQRFAAMVDADVGELAPMLADDLTYVHSTGQVQTKPELLQALASGALDYASIEPREQNVRVFKKLAMVQGVIAVTATIEGQKKPSTMDLRYTDVYVFAEDRWQLVAWQSTRVP